MKTQLTVAVLALFILCNGCKIFKSIKTQNQSNFHPTKNKNTLDDKIYEEDVPAAYINAGAGISGNIDSTLSKSANASFELQMNRALFVSASFNLGVNPDTIKQGENFNGRSLLYPDASKVGFCASSKYEFYRFRVLEGTDNALASMALKYDYCFQNRLIIKQDSIPDKTQKFNFNSGSHTISLVGQAWINSGDNKIGFRLIPFYTWYNIGRPTFNDFKTLFSYVTLPEGTREISRKYRGAGFRSSVFFNKVEFFFVYTHLVGKKNIGLYFPGLTKEQYFIGVNIRADFLKFPGNKK